MPQWWRTNLNVQHSGSKAKAEEAAQRLIELAQREGFQVLNAMTAAVPPDPIQHEVPGESEG